MKDIYVIRIPSNLSSKEPLVWIAALNGECIGHVRLSIEHNQIKYHDAWVHPDYRRQGVYTALWKARDTYAKQHFAGQKSYAWCKAGSLPVYIKNGYVQGESCVYVEKDLES